MLKKKFLSILLTGVCSFGIVGCTNAGTGASEQTSAAVDKIDYVAQAKLNEEYKDKNYLTDGVGEVTVYQYIDGDTTHFIEKDGRQVRTRYGGINTPESTAQVQKWGKSASIFTETKLESAKHIVLTKPTMDGGVPELDSTNTRYMTFVWYTTVDDPSLDDFRLLNLEIVQEGYSSATGMNATDPFYDLFQAAQRQASDLQLHIHSPSETVDENFYEGEAQTLTVQQFNEKAAEYVGVKVHIPSAIVAGYLGVSSVWLESIGVDPDTGANEVYGLYVFAGYNGDAVPLFTVGNEVSLTGVVSEFNGEYQLTGVTYSQFLPSDDDVKLLSSGNDVPDKGQVGSLEELFSGTWNANTFVTITDELTCTGGHGGTDEIDDRTGLPYDNDAFTLYCKNSEGTELQIYIPDGSSFRDDNRNLVHSYTFFVGKTFTVRGIPEYYQDKTNLEVPGYENLTFVE